MENTIQNKVPKICVALLLAMILLYLFPLVYRIHDLNFSVFSKNQDGLQEAWLRSSIFAIFSTIINVVGGLIVAIALRKVSFNSSRGKYLAFLLIPVMLGHLSIAFIGKLLLTQSLFQEYTTLKFLLLILIQFWQYGTLFIYLFWLVIQNIPKSVWTYAYATKIGTSKQIKDIILPACRDLSILLFILNFIFSIFEDAKVQFIFKASRGTNTEMIAQWLNRNHQSLSLIDVNFAIKNTIQIAVIVTIFAVITVLFSSLLYRFTYLRVIRRRNIAYSNREISPSTMLYLLLAVFVVTPLMYVFVRFHSLKIFDLTSLLFPLMCTFIAAALSTTLAISLGIFLRLAWQRIFASFNKKSFFFFLFIFFLQLIPPITLIICGFQWLRITGYNGVWKLYSIWTIAHVILAMPLLSSFMVVTHFRAKKVSLDFMRAFKLSSLHVLKDCFLKPFALDYLLTFLIAFSLIWNESIINNILSDFIPSFVSQMKMSITGRSADYLKGMSYLLISCLITFLSLGIWKTVLKKLQKNEVSQI